MIINKGKEAVRVASEHLGPLIEERMTKMEQYGDSWEDKPVSLSDPSDPGLLMCHLAERPASMVSRAPRVGQVTSQDR